MLQFSLKSIHVTQIQWIYQIMMPTNTWLHQDRRMQHTKGDWSEHSSSIYPSGLGPKSSLYPLSLHIIHQYKPLTWLHVVVVTLGLVQVNACWSVCDASLYGGYLGDLLMPACMGGVWKRANFSEYRNFAVSFFDLFYCIFGRFGGSPKKPGLHTKK